MADFQQIDQGGFAAGDVGQIRSWRSIVTLIVFVITSELSQYCFL